MVTVSPASSDKSEKASEKPTEDRTVTSGNITNNELLSLLHFVVGSPNGSVDEWLKECNNNNVW